MATVIVDSAEALRALAGRELGVTDWMTMTQERVNQFADATGDHQWIHIDADRAKKESPYGTTIAHGFLTLSLTSQFVRQIMEPRRLKMAINYGLNKVRFPAAVRTGTNIRARVKLDSVKEAGDAVEAVYVVTVDTEGSEKPNCVAEWVARYYW